MAAERAGVLSRVLKNDTWIVALALAAMAAISWWYLIWFRAGMAPSQSIQAMSGMPGMAAMMTPASSQWSLPMFLAVFAMWMVMMVGMMTPSAAPTILLHQRVASDATTRGISFASSTFFAAGYFLAWAIFSLVAALGQYGLDKLLLLTPMMELKSRPVSGAVFIAAGIYQLSPAKDACLAWCRSPFLFIQHHGGFQPSALGAVRLGSLHGLYCVGCCWILMSLLFVGGVMNLVWIAAIAGFVLVEKLMPLGNYVAKAAGIAALGIGAYLIAT